VDVRQVWREYFALLGRLVGTRLYDVVGHFDLPKKFGHRISDRDLCELAPPVLDRVAAAGMAIEINTSGLRRPVGEVYPSAAILAMARERDLPIVFGSDAHEPEHVGADFEQAVATARAAGYTHVLTWRARRSEAVPLPG
jgi:histidinol-phosphatase (PHP family)